MNEIERAQLMESTKHHEGKRLKAYQDTKDVWTIGYGTNLQKLEIDDDLAELWLEEKLTWAEAGVSSQAGYDDANGVRQATMVEMAYQLGVRGSLRFVLFWAAVATGEWKIAASEMLDSHVARVTAPKRWAEMAARMRHGTWDGRPSPG